MEGGCPYLEAADGTRYEVIYPNGWQLDRAALAAARAPTGPWWQLPATSSPFAAQLATDMVSTCQIGPIFRATEVVSVD